MRMGFLFSGLFWGILLILIGITIVIKVFFKVDIPIVRIGFALFFVYIGISILLNGDGKKHRHSDSDVVFEESDVNVTKDQKEYNVIFGKVTYDLTKLDITNTNDIEINVVFGAAEIILDKNMPVILTVDSAFAGAKLPDGNSVAFGTTHYTSPSYRGDAPALKIKVDVVFGGVDFQNR